MAFKMRVRNLRFDTETILGFYVYAVIDPKAGEVLYVDWGAGNDYNDPDLWHTNATRRTQIHRVLERGDQIDYLFHETHFMEVGDAIRAANAMKSKYEFERPLLPTEGWLTVEQLNKKFALPRTPRIDKRILAIPLPNSWSSLVTKEQILKHVKGPWPLSKKAAENAEIVLGIWQGVILGVFEIEKFSFKGYNSSHGMWSFEEKETLSDELIALVGTSIGRIEFRRRFPKYLDGYVGEITTNRIIF